MGRGKLVFKGDKPEKKKKKSKKKHSVGGRGEESATLTSAGASPLASSAAPSAARSASVGSATDRTPSVERGRGRITTSGTVLTGHGTDLKSTLRPGDAITVSIDGEDEMRVVTMVLSDVSGAVSTPFSSDVGSPAPFRFIRKPRDLPGEKVERERRAAEDKEDDERRAFGTYGSSAAGRKKSGVAEMVYRERTEHGSYRIRREEVEGDASRSDLLDMRSKKKSDKYC